jgi:hypothetical protein
MLGSEKADEEDSMSRHVLDCESFGLMNLENQTCKLVRVVTYQTIFVQQVPTDKLIALTGLASGI